MAAKKQAAEYPRSEPLLCATAGCPHIAMVRIQRRKAEWVDGKVVHTAYGPKLNLCWSCDDAMHREESCEFCFQMGLDTPAKQRAWCLENRKKIVEELAA